MARPALSGATVRGHEHTFAKPPAGRLTVCLGVPGRVVEVQPNAIGIPTGRVEFGGLIKEVCLAYTPDVSPGEYVVVHVGFAISTIDEEEAKRIFAYLTESGELAGELGPPDSAAAVG
jgi:hydrogenase expression/formation protein HypC